MASYINIGSAGFSKAERGPIDKNIVFSTIADLSNFVQADPGTAYAGQIISLSDTSTELYKVIYENSEYRYVKLLGGIWSNMSRLENNINVLGRNTSGIQTNISNIQTNISNIQNDVSNAKNDISNAQNDISDMQDDISTLRVDLQNIGSVSKNIFKLINDKITPGDYPNLLGTGGYQIDTTCIYLVPVESPEESNKFIEWIIKPDLANVFDDNQDGVIKTEDIESVYNKGNQDNTYVQLVNNIAGPTGWVDLTTYMEGGGSGMPFLWDLIGNSPEKVFEKIGEVAVNSDLINQELTNIINDVSVLREDVDQLMSIAIYDLD